MKYKQMLKIRKTEKDPQVRDRILLNVLVKRDGMSVTGAALHLGMAPSWGSSSAVGIWKSAWRGADPLPYGMIPQISRKTAREIKKARKIVCPTAEGLLDLMPRGLVSST